MIAPLCWLAAAVASQYFDKSIDKNRRYIGESQANWTAKKDAAAPAPAGGAVGGVDIPTDRVGLQQHRVAAGHRAVALNLVDRLSAALNRPEQPALREVQTVDLLRHTITDTSSPKRREISAGRGGHADCERSGAQYRQTGVFLSQSRIPAAIRMPRRWYVDADGAGAPGNDKAVRAVVAEPIDRAAAVRAVPACVTLAGLAEAVPWPRPLRLNISRSEPTVHR
eukprot:COSAG01_NODE_11153_length_1994_cov_9.048734_2_plen_224_part_00